MCGRSIFLSRGMPVNECGCPKSAERKRSRFAERRENIETFDRAASAEARACRVLSGPPLLIAVSTRLYSAPCEFQAKSESFYFYTIYPRLEKQPKPANHGSKA